MAVLFETLYGIPPSQKTRDRPMQVLCLGLSRTGTESLRNALIDIGYDKTYHGYSFSANFSDLRSLSDLYEKKLSGHLIGVEPEQLRLEFDRIFGDGMAVTDAPASVLASEMLRAYPDAKVVLNQRHDIDAWEQSMLTTVVAGQKDWKTWSLSLFDREVFWLQRILKQSFQTFFKGDFGKFGKEVYREHYSRLREELAAEDREYLDWKPEDGWKPLCELLGKEIPDRPFPSGNNTIEFNKRLAQRHAERLGRAKKNALMVLGGSLAIGIATLLALTTR